MSIYSAKYRLTSCKVTKELIGEIEKYILAEAKTYLLKCENVNEGNFNESAVNEMYQLHIQDKDESVKYASIEEYKDEKLPDGTKTVILELRSMVEQFFHIKVIFNASISGHPVLEIAMADRNAKEICNPIADGIVKLIKGHRNYNFLFHSRYVQVGLLILYAVSIVRNYYVLCMPGYQDTSPFYLANFIIFSFSFSAIILWFIISIFMRRFTTFDTKRQKIINICYYLITATFFLLIAYYLYHGYTLMHPYRY